MTDLNEIILTGGIGKDIELKYTNTGKAVGSTSLAVSKKYGDKETTTWFNLEVWEKLAEWLNSKPMKGARVTVRGEMLCNEYEQGGTKKQYWKVVVRDFVIQKWPGEKAPSNAGDPGTQERFEDDIPF